MFAPEPPTEIAPWPTNVDLILTISVPHGAVKLLGIHIGIPLLPGIIFKLREKAQSKA